MGKRTKVKHKIDMPDDYPWSDQQLTQKLWWASGVVSQLSQAANDNDVPQSVKDAITGAERDLSRAYTMMEQHINQT